MMAAPSPADAMRQRRLIFERAIADNITMAEARERLARERFAESERRLAEKRCGTAIAPAPAGDLSDRWMMRE